MPTTNQNKSTNTMAPITQDAGALTRTANQRQAISHHVRQQIHTGQWKLDQRIPTESQLAKQFGTSKSLVNQALKVLETQGILKRYRRKGTFVACTAPLIHTSLSPSENNVCKQVHVLAPIDTLNMSMHWNHGTFNQLESVFNASGLQMVHVSVPNQLTPEILGQTVSQLTSERSRGLLILHNMISCQEANPDALNLMDYALQLQTYPGRICWLNRSGMELSAWPYDAVSFSPLQQGVMVGQYLVQNAVKRVICMVLTDRPWSRSRAEGVKKILGQQTTPIPINRFDLDGQLDLESEKSWRDILQDISTNQDRPTVVAPNDIYAAKMIDAAASIGLSCPEDFCIVSFDNYEPCRSHNITTTAPMSTHLGEAVGMLMCNSLRYPTNASVHLNIRSIIIERCTFMSQTP